MTNPVNLWVAHQFRVLRRRSSCVQCGTKSQLQFAHIRETILSGRKGRGRKERWYDLVRNADCYTVLCRYCHRLYDDEGLNRQVAFPSLRDLYPSFPDLGEV